MNTTSILLFVGVVLFFLLCLAWPLVRLYRRTGTWALVQSKRTRPAEHVIGASLSILLVGVLAWAVLNLFLDPVHLAIWSAPEWLTLTGAGLAGVGLLIVAAAQAQMGASWRIGIDEQPTDLVVSGLFRAVRNPIYSGVFVALFGLVLLTPSPWTVAILAFTLMLIAIQTRLEEEHLLKEHGDSYQTYAQRVGRFFPGCGRF